MAAEVFAFLAYDFAKPPFQFRIADIVVIDPVFVTGIVGRIDVDALDTAFVVGEQGFQGFEIVAVNNAILSTGSVVSECVLRVEHPKRYVVVMVDYLIFPNPGKCGHYERRRIAGERPEAQGAKNRVRPPLPTLYLRKARPSAKQGLNVDTAKGTPFRVRPLHHLLPR